MSDNTIEFYDDSDEDVKPIEVRTQTSKLYQGTNSSQPDLAIPTPPARSQQPPQRFKIPLHSARPKPRHATVITTAIEEETEDEDGSEPAPAPTVTTLPRSQDRPSAHCHPLATGRPPLRPILPYPTPSQPKNHHQNNTNEKPTDQKPPPPPPPPPRPASPERPGEPKYHDRTHYTGYVGWWNDHTGRGLLVDSRRPFEEAHMVGLKEIAPAGYGALLAGALLEWEYDEGVVRKVWVWPGCEIVLYRDAWADKITYPYMYYEPEEGYTPEIR